MTYHFKYLQPEDIAGNEAIYAVKRIFVRLLGGSHTYALILEEAWYWQHRALQRGETEFNMSLTAEHSGPSWKDYCVKQGQLDGFRSLLEPYGILRSRAGYFRGRKTTFFQLDLEALDEAIGKFKLDGKPLVRAMTVSKWRIWRRELAAKHPRTKERILLPVIAYAAVSGTSNTAIAPTDPAAKIKIAPKRAAVTTLPKPTLKTKAPAEPIADKSPAIAPPQPVSVPTLDLDTEIAPDDWFSLDPIARNELRLKARSRYPGLAHVDARILGYGDIIGNNPDTRTGRTQFPEAIVDIALDKLSKTSLAATATQLDARNWIARACTNLSSTDYNQMRDGVARLDFIATTISEREARAAARKADYEKQMAAIDAAEARRRAEEEAKPLNGDQVRAMDDYEIVNCPKKMWRDEDWRREAQFRIDSPVHRTRQAGEPLVGDQMRKPYYHKCTQDDFWTPEEAARQEAARIAELEAHRYDPCPF